MSIKKAFILLNQIVFKCFSGLTSFKTEVVECINLLLHAPPIFWQSLGEEKSNTLLN
jgi:hypothetical protein